MIIKKIALYMGYALIISVVMCLLGLFFKTGDITLNILNVFFTVSSIFFSILISIVVSFNLSKVYNVNLLENLKENLISIRWVSLVGFIINCILVAIYNFKPTLINTEIFIPKINVYFPIGLFPIGMLCTHILYNAIHGVFRLDHLKRSIEDAIRKEDVNTRDTIRR